MTSEAFRWPRTVSAMGALLLSLAFLLSSAAPASPAPRASKIDADVLDRLQSSAAAKVFVILKAKADLSGAPAVKDWTARGWFVVNRLKATAEATQGGVRALLASRGLEARPFWIVNAVLTTADAATIDVLAARPEVARIRLHRTVPLPPTIRGEAGSPGSAPEWGIVNIRADDVWADFGTRGAGITVANIDTGVQYTHAALDTQYRGRKADGTFNHNYNWWDPSEVCGNPSLAPCDNNGHGTHTMGTMVGEDGANQIGVAPEARWIAAKGCESNSCSDFALLSSGEWILAPTKINGSAPRAGRRPHIVNNSWGTPAGGDDFYQSTVQAWVASGIFPQFSNGNSGPGCGTVGAPGSYPESYGSGAYDINNVIASFSSRGPSPFGSIIKPNISAPGVNVRSSWNNGGYLAISGTSMASPHVAGTVALIWSAAPSLLRDIAGTRPILDSTAIDTANSTCGGTTSNNNVWGQGRLDAYAAVDLANG
ncbi:MAG: S8 family serine peptidase [Actinobacteria bacterium]|nr:S8 family serine peptidase [Actinomycetota bacterium]